MFTGESDKRAGFVLHLAEKINLQAVLIENLEGKYHL
jgi:hypothetical protein